MAPISWPQQQLVQHCQALASSHKDCRQFRWRASMVRHSRSVAFQHLQHCRGWAARVQAAAKQDTQPAGQRSVDCVSTGMDTEGMVSQDEDAGSSSKQPRQQSEGTVDAAVEPAGQLAAFLLLISPFFFWGTSMVAMKELAPHTSPLFVSAVRLLPAGGALIAWAAAQGRRQPEGLQAWGAIALFGLVDGTAFQGCLAEGLQRTSAGLGSVIIDSQPLTVTLLAALLFGERIRPAGALGLLAGVAGLCLLELPPEALQGSVQQSTTGGLGSWLPKGSSLWDSGAWWMLLSAQSMAVGTIMVRWVCRYVDPVMATGWHMVLGGMPLLALSAAQEADELIPRLAQITGYDLALLVYISMLGSAASYGVFFYNASRGNLTALSSLTFLTPMFAAGCGYLTIGETLTPLQLVGASITLGGVALINAKPADKEGSS